MKLDKFEYTYNKGQDDEWIIEDCQLSQINLIVGKNASGKSRIVEAIYNISNLLTERNLYDPRHRTYKLFLESENGIKIEYILEVKDNVVKKESLTINDENVLIRDQSGEGTIKAEKIGQLIDIKIPPNKLAVTRRDETQHPFLEYIYEWANSLRFYQFGTQLGKRYVLRSPETVDVNLLKQQTDFRNYDQVISIFVIGKQEFDNKFIEKVLADMKEIGFSISEIDTKQITLDNSSPNPDNNLPHYLYVQEDDLKSPTDQLLMSQGMFRVLSLLIQINYSLLAGKPSCIIIDDIGEGLDYQRSSAMIKLLIEKAKTGLVQLIMTTNDEFIMNGVPLEYWSVIERKSGEVKLHNIFNSREKFEQFEFIGLNNFDFFTSEFALQELDEEE